MKSRVPIAALTAILALTTTSCSTASTSIAASGRVDTASVDLQVPALIAPSVDLEAGFTPEAGQVPTRKVSSTQPRMRVLRAARLGAKVEKGQVVAVFERGGLRAAVAKARAERRLARTQVDVVDDRLATVADNRTKALDAQSLIRDKIAQAKRMRPVLRSNLRKLRQVLASIPDIAETQAQRAKIKAAIAKLTKALRAIDAGLAQARAGLAKISDGLGQLEDAQVSLTGVRRTVLAQGPAADAALVLARWQLSQAVVRAPVSGVVEEIARPGDVLAAGSLVARLRNAGPATLTVWVSPERAAHVCTDAVATLSADWSAETMGARVSTVGTRAEYPPTRQTTDDTHLTRAVPITLTASGALPPGAPIDVEISTCEPKE